MGKRVWVAVYDPERTGARVLGVRTTPEAAKGLAEAHWGRERCADDGLLEWRELGTDRRRFHIVQSDVGGPGWVADNLYDGGYLVVEQKVQA